MRDRTRDSVRILEDTYNFSIYKILVVAGPQLSECSIVSGTSDPLNGSTCGIDLIVENSHTRPDLLIQWHMQSKYSAVAQADRDLFCISQNMKGIMGKILNYGVGFAAQAV